MSASTPEPRTADAAVHSAPVTRTTPALLLGAAVAVPVAAALVIFPEGTRSGDGWMHTFRMGAAYLSHTHDVPIVPVAHRGTFAAMPRGAGWPGRDEGGRPGVGAEVVDLGGDDCGEVRLGGGADHEGHETCLRALGSTASGRRR